MRKLFFISITAISLAACTKNELGEKHLTQLPYFNRVEIKDAFNVSLKEDTSNSLSIIGNEDYFEHLDARVEDSTLIIEYHKKARWLNPKGNKLELIIHSNQLKQVFVHEGSFVKTLNPITSNEFGLVLDGKANEAELELNCNTFYYWNNFPCGGKLTLKGSCNNLRLWNFALMSVDAKTLVAQNAWVENHSKGNCEVFVNAKLEYKVTGAGSIYLYGNPPELIPLDANSGEKLVRL